MSAGLPLLAAAHGVGVALRPGNGKCLFLFLPITCCACLCRAGKGELLGESRPCGVGVGRRTGESFLASANLATQHSAAVAPAFFVRLGGGAHSGTLPCPSWTLERFPEETQATGHAHKGRPSLPGCGYRRLGSVEFNLGTELSLRPICIRRAPGGVGRGLVSTAGVQPPAPGWEGEILFTGSLSRQQ